MTNSTVTPVPLDTAATVAAAAAQGAHDALAATLAKARTAGLSVLTKAYGPDADSASITLASRAAAVMAGGKKPQGGAGQRINDAVKLATAAATAAADGGVTAYILATAARTVLDAHKADSAARRKAESDTRAAAKSVLNDRGRSLADRMQALEVMTAVDAAAAERTAETTRESFVRAVTAAQGKGWSAQQLADIIGETFGVAVAVQHDALEVVAA